MSAILFSNGLWNAQSVADFGHSRVSGFGYILYAGAHVC